MSRVKRGVTARARHKKVLDKAKGYYGARSRVFRVAKQAVIKAAQYAFRDRRQRKREFRALWIIRVNAAARAHGMSYNTFMNGLKKAAIQIDRKILADIAVHDQASFAALVEQAKNVRNILVVFGAPKHGVHEIIAKEGASIKPYLHVVNMFPNQGTETVRLEEAVLGTLAILNNSLQLLYDSGRHK